MAKRKAALRGAAQTLNAAAQALGRVGGLANTKAQQRARSANAKQGGRPRRVCVHCGEPVRGGHMDRARDESCGAHGWRWQTPSERRKAE